MVAVASGRGKTFTVSSASTPRRPSQPTISLGTSKPAAFLTTCRPRTRQAAGAVDEADAEHEVAHPAIAIGAGSADARGDRAAQRRAGSPPAAGRTAGTARAGQDAAISVSGVPARAVKRQLGGVVVDDAAQSADVERDDPVRGPC